MNKSIDSKTQIYLKLIDYKRSIGVTQWTVLSVFLTASGTLFVIGLKEFNGIDGLILRIFAVLVYWLGFMFYRRYRNLNSHVSSYLIKLEKEIDLNFQSHLNEQFHSNKQFSTEKILLYGGVFFTILSLIIFFK